MDLWEDESEQQCGLSVCVLASIPIVTGLFLLVKVVCDVMVSASEL